MPTTQANILSSYKDKAVVLASDGRCDSPGSSAKFCTYSFMDIETNTIIHVETVDKREVNLKSPNMEREGFLRGMKFFHNEKVKVTELVTDGSTSVKKDLGKF